MTMYAVVDVVTVSQLDNAIQIHVENLRKNIDGTKCILKFNTKNGAVPDAFHDSVLYSYDEIVTELANPEWDLGETV